MFAARTGRLGNDVAAVDLATEAVTSIAISACEAAIVEVLRADASGLLYAGVSGFRDGDVVVVDAAAQRVVATMWVGAPVRDITLSPDGAMAYVLTHHHPRGTAAVLRIDLMRRVIGAVVEVGESATQVAMSPDGAEVFVIARDGVAVICTSTGAMLDRIAVGERPSCMAVSPATGWLYVADYVGVLTGLPVLQAVDTNVVAELQSAAV